MPENGRRMTDLEGFLTKLLDGKFAETHLEIRALKTAIDDLKEQKSEEHEAMRERISSLEASRHTFKISLGGLWALLLVAFGGFVSWVRGK